MHLLYQIPGDVTAGPLGRSELVRRERILQEWAASGVVTEVADAPGGPLSIESHAEEALCVAPMIAALRRRTVAPDAVIIGCFGDPGLAALREIMDCPVVGPFESAFHLAAQLGHRVGVVTILESVVAVLDALVRGMGLSLRYAGATAIAVPVLDLPNEGSQQLAVRVTEAAAPLIRDHRADVLVLGCMSMAFQGIAERVAAEAGVPVVNPAFAALKTAESFVSQGLIQSRLAFAKPRKPIVA